MENQDSKTNQFYNPTTTTIEGQPILIIIKENGLNIMVSQAQRRNCVRDIIEAIVRKKGISKNQVILTEAASETPLLDNVIIEKCTRTTLSSCCPQLFNTTSFDTNPLITAIQKLRRNIPVLGTVPVLENLSSDLPVIVLNLQILIPKIILLVRQDGSVKQCFTTAEPTKFRKILETIAEKMKVEQDRLVLTLPGSEMNCLANSTVKDSSRRFTTWSSIPDREKNAVLALVKNISFTDNQAMLVLDLTITAPTLEPKAPNIVEEGAALKTVFAADLRSKAVVQPEIPPPPSEKNVLLFIKEKTTQGDRTAGILTLEQSEPLCHVANKISNDAGVDIRSVVLSQGPDTIAFSHNLTIESNGCTVIPLESIPKHDRVLLAEKSTISFHNKYPTVVLYFTINPNAVVSSKTSPPSDAEESQKRRRLSP